MPTATNGGYAATISKIANIIQSGECVLFLGAGVHRAPGKGTPADTQWPYPPVNRPAQVEELAFHLAKNSGVLVERRKERRNAANLGRMAMFYERKYGRNELVDQVIAAVHDGVWNGAARTTAPSRAVSGLAELPFKMVMTTNYDRLFESALPPGKQARVGVYKPNKLREEMTDDFHGTVAQPFVYKLHGDVLDRKSLVITDEDYIHFILRMSDAPQTHPVPKRFIEAFVEWPTLFVGYSLLDYNLRLLIRALRGKADPAEYKPMYSIDYQPDPLIEHYYGEGNGRYVWFIAQDLWTVVPNIYQAVMGKPLL